MEKSGLVGALEGWGWISLFGGVIGAWVTGYSLGVDGNPNPNFREETSYAIFFGIGLAGTAIAIQSGMLFLWLSRVLMHLENRTER